jgi:plastocyanin
MVRFVTAVSLILLAAGCGEEDGSGEKDRARTNVVEAFDLGFRPSELSVEAGATVRWTNAGNQIHNVRQLPGSKERFFSRAIDPGADYARRFSAPGTYPYFCTLHPTQMRGTVEVR